ncbi:hypothetical protein VTH82DRAFT_5042 [Thermothelomyces myriococcoides]
MGTGPGKRFERHSVLASGSASREPAHGFTGTVGPWAAKLTGLNLHGYKSPFLCSTPSLVVTANLFSELSSK